VKKAAPIMIVAPYSPIGSGDIPALGAAKKIASVVSALSALGRDVILVNSAHNARQHAPMRIERSEIRPGLRICTVTLPTRTNRPLGKAVNLLFARSLAREVIREVAADGVALIWIYNGYAFESRFALEVMGKTGCPLVIELEDMPFARKRPANLKPMLDNYYLHCALPEASLVTYVNEFIPQALGAKPKKTLLLPGLVDNALLDPVTAKVPFSGTIHTAGYFGNLSVEKGAHLILQLLQNPPIGWRFVVTGSGPLVGDFSAAAQQHPEVLRFVPNASDTTVVAGILECDAIINPHQSIADMGNGIFPFKVLEALASGRLVVSTPLPVCGLPLDAAVLYFDHGVVALHTALRVSSQFYAAHVSVIASLASDVRVRFSELALTNEIRRAFFPVGVSS